MKSLPVSQARENLAEVIAGLADGPVEITRHGVALAYMVSSTMFDRLTDRPPHGHVFATDKYRPATISIDELLAIEPVRAEGDGPTLSEILLEMRADER